VNYAVFEIRQAINGLIIDPLIIKDQIDGTSIVTTLDDEVWLNEFINNKDDLLIDRNVFIDKFHTTKNKQLVWCNEAVRALRTENAGGSSEQSEALSIHYFNKRFGVNSFVLENDVKYDFYGCSICDFLINLGTHRIGVSVTRAMNHKDSNKFTVEDGLKLLDKKLKGLIIARNGISESHSFFKCILHIWCQSDHISNMIKNAYSEKIENTAKDDCVRDVVVMITVCSDRWIYENNLS